MRDAWRAGAAAATTAISVAVALAGCGGMSAQHGDAAKSAQQIAADAVAATDVTLSDLNQSIALAAPPSPLDLTSLRR